MNVVIGDELGLLKQIDLKTNTPFIRFKHNNSSNNSNNNNNNNNAKTQALFAANSVDFLSWAGETEQQRESEVCWIEIGLRLDSSTHSLVLGGIGSS